MAEPSSMLTGPRWLWLFVVAALVLAALLLVGPAPESLRPILSARFPDIRWVDTPTLAAWMDRESAIEPLIFDARSREEFAVSHLPGAIRVDPDQPELDSLAVPHAATVVVYCAIGYRSGAIAERLQSMGVDHVYNLTGGIFAWANEGRPLVRDGTPTNAVHPYDALWGRFLHEDLRAKLGQ